MDEEASLRPQQLELVRRRFDRDHGLDDNRHRHVVAQVEVNANAGELLSRAYIGGLVAELAPMVLVA